MVNIQRVCMYAIKSFMNRLPVKPFWNTRAISLTYHMVDIFEVRKNILTLY